MKKYAYIFHYLLLIIAAYCYDGYFMRAKVVHKQFNSGYSVAAGINGIDNSSDKFRVTVFKQKASDNHLAWKTCDAPRAKVKYSGGNCKYHLGEFNSVIGTVSFNEDNSSVYCPSCSRFKFDNAHKLRGPPAFII